MLGDRSPSAFLAPLRADATQVTWGDWTASRTTSGVTLSPALAAALLEELAQLQPDAGAGPGQVVPAKPTSEILAAIATATGSSPAAALQAWRDALRAAEGRIP